MKTVLPGFELRLPHQFTPIITLHYKLVKISSKRNFTASYAV